MGDNEEKQYKIFLEMNGISEKFDGIQKIQMPEIAEKPKAGENEFPSEFWVSRKYSGEKEALFMQGEIDADCGIGYYRYKEEHDSGFSYYAVDLKSGLSFATSRRGWKDVKKAVAQGLDKLQKRRSDSSYGFLCARFAIMVAQSMLREKMILQSIEEGRKRHG